MIRLTFLGLLAFMVMLISCSKSGNSQNKDINSSKIPKYQLSKDSLDISYEVDIIEQSDCYYGKSVGLAGQPSRVYQAFENLKRVASDSLWLSLAKSSSSPLKLYAYEALKSNKELQDNLYKTLKNDSTEICIYSNDILIKCKLGEYLTLMK